MRRFWLLCWLAFAAAAPGQAPEIVRRSISAPPTADAVVLKQDLTLTLAPDGTVRRRVHRFTRVLKASFFRTGGCEPRVLLDPQRERFRLLTLRTWPPGGKPVATDPAAGSVAVLPAGLDRAPAYAFLREQVLVHTGVTHGAVLETAYEVERRRNKGEPFWGVEALGAAQPVAEVALTLRVPAGTALQAAVVPEGKALKAATAAGQDVYRVERRELPGGSELRVVYSSVPTWAEAGTWLERRLGAALEGASRVETWARERVRGKTDPRERVWALHDGVVAEWATVPLGPERIGYRLRPVAEVAATGYATPLEKAVLLLAALRAAGLRGEVFLAGAPDRVAVPVPVPLCLPEVWVAADVAGERLWLDPARSLAETAGTPPLGRVLLPVRPRGAALQRLPWPEPATNRVDLQADLALTEGGAVGTLRLEWTGPASPYHRLRLKQVRPAELVQAAFGERAGEVQVAEVSYRHLAERRVALSAQVAAPTGGFTPPGATALLLPLPPGGLLDRLADALASDRRRKPLPVGPPAREEVRISVTWRGEDRALLRAPKPVKAAGPWGVVERTVTRSRNRCTVHTRIEIRTSTVSPEAYPAFRRALAALRSQAGRLLLWGLQGG